MSKPVATDPRVIDSPKRAPRWPKHGPEVRKIVVGTLARDGEPLSMPELPPDLATRFPSLTHLYLWRISDLRAIPALPAGLKCLDVRDCADLKTLPPLPPVLETLVLEDCPRLASLPLPEKGRLTSLVELSLAGCPVLPPNVLDALLAAAPRLRILDSSRCPQVTRVTEWPAELERIDMNDGTSLKALPARWPAKLRRLGLRGSSGLSRLSDLPGTIDYLDLAGTTSLRALPRQWGRPRTLYLHGSGVVMPPASEHGSKPSENVATRTSAYFDDVALVGSGSVNRCKLMLLGNGSAGKTCLALRLLPGKDPTRDHPGSTHGVQFWDWDFRADVGGSVEPVHLHLWDFGGQEIYHATHRLFMSKGTVFVVLWKPEQDGHDGPEADDADYQDRWRPLQYWLDLIHFACPHEPRIALVCSHHAGRDESLQAKWTEQVSEAHQDLPCFYIDSRSGAGDVAALEQWLEQEVGEVVHSQGTFVPSYWEIAQNLVGRWLAAGASSGGQEATPPAVSLPKYRTLRPDEFRDELRVTIDEAIASDREGRFAKLAGALREGTFELTDDRIHRTLGFLTHGGWVYWDGELFEDRVIVGQQWALDGIYSVLERRPDREVYGRLLASGGQFTRKSLDEWAWRDMYSPEEQELLVSFMKSANVCFELVRGRDSLWGEAVYRTFEHLPRADARELRLRARFGGKPDAVSRTVECRQLHEGHWHALLKDLGERYGTDAKYASDGFYLENDEGQTIFIELDADPKGLGGKLGIHVSGPHADARVDALDGHVRSFVPEALERQPPAAIERDSSPGGGPAGTVEPRTKVFFSYAWDPELAGIPKGYEKPVDAIEHALKDERVELLRDKHVVQGGDSIVEFMQRAKTTDKVLVVHSDKYWRSSFCLFELWVVLDSLMTRSVGAQDVLVLVEHLESGLQDSKSMDAHRDAWRAAGRFPTMLRKVVTDEDLRRHVEYVFADGVPTLSGLHDRNRAWRDKDAAGLIQWIKRLIAPNGKG